MKSTEEVLRSLATELGCAHVVLHSPTLFVELVTPAPAPADATTVDSLARHVLWPMAQKGDVAQILNRARLKREAPILPYRILLCPIRSENQSVGFLAALRTHEQPIFSSEDAARLTDASTQVQEMLTRASAGHSGLLRRPDLQSEVALRSKGVDVVSVVYADLDQLHAINEVAGFEAGDEVIRAVGRLWQSLLAADGSVASRLSGDRYAAVLFNHTLPQARAWAERAREAIARLEIRGRRSRITASLGVASLPRGGEFEHTLAAAETACRAAKDRGRNRVEIYESADASMMRRHEEVHESRVVLEALESDRLALHAMPIVPLASPGAAAHYEILLRLRGSDGAFLSIGDYLKAAERYQLLERLDRWVIEHTLAVLAPHAVELKALGMRFAINVTGQSLSEPEFADFVRTEVERRGVPGSLLAFEFTETAAVKSIRTTQRFVAEMAAIGSHVALDDFGTGLSSLVHLKELAVQQIKIDGQFVLDVVTDTRSEALVRALVQIGEQLGLDTVAEFVENEQIAAHLKKLGVRYAQGYLYGRAQPLEETLAALLAGEWLPAVAQG